MLKALIKSLRPKQWTKNFLVFGALVFVPGAIAIPNLGLRALCAFVLFSLASSAGYLVNDILDREYDRQHPSKKYRPIASGELSVPVAAAFAIVALIVVIIGSLYLDRTDVSLPPAATPLNGTAYPFLITIVGYIVLTFLYSTWFKKIPILDVLVLSIGFTLRAVGGAVALKVIFSPWLLLCTGLLALYLALGKRRQEIIRLNNVGETAKDIQSIGGRQALSGYNIPLLDQLLIMSASVNIMSYSLYTFSASGHPDNRLMLTIPFVIYGIFRYHSLIHKEDAGEAPDEVLLSDRPLVICLILWVLSVSVLFFYPGFT
ncbi:MAG: decaprenyl-phosphate phosphoribosyltransferase [bacterium]|nr:decaprenyl-phosphate phosphoribosyltransferase [bacterium]